MINVRLQVFLNDREFWSSAIHNPTALRELTGSLSRGGIKHAVFDDFGHANIADGCLAVANKLGGPDGPVPFQWGHNRQFCCLMAPVPKATGKLSWENCHADPRELSGPLPEEVAGHTPCACCDADVANITITAFDVHGAPDRPTASPTAAPVVTVQPLLRRATLLERIMQMITGCPRGEAVRGQ